MRLIDANDLPTELKALIPQKEIILLFGDKGVSVKEFTVKQYNIFLKYFTGFMKKYQEKVNEKTKEKKAKSHDDSTITTEDVFVSLIEVIPEIIKEHPVDEYFKQMFKELYPGLDDALLDNMTHKQLFYNLGVLQSENFTSAALPPEIEKRIQTIKSSLGLI